MSPRALIAGGIAAVLVGTGIAALLYYTLSGDPAGMSSVGGTTTTVATTTGALGGSSSKRPWMTKVSPILISASLIALLFVSESHRTVLTFRSSTRWAVKLLVTVALLISALIYAVATKTRPSILDVTLIALAVLLTFFGLVLYSFLHGLVTGTILEDLTKDGQSAPHAQLSLIDAEILAAALKGHGMRMLPTALREGPKVLKDDSAKLQELLASSGEGLNVRRVAANIGVVLDEPKRDSPLSEMTMAIALLNYIRISGIRAGDEGYDEVRDTAEMLLVEIDKVVKGPGFEGFERELMLPLQRRLQAFVE